MAATGRERKRVDLSHTVRDGMVTYKGLPAPVICDFLSRADSESHYAQGTTFQIGQITMCANTGTYLDSPFHRYEDGADLAALPLDRLAELDGVLIDASEDGRIVDLDRLRSTDLRGRAVLIRTDWDSHWGDESYFEGHPFITREAASYLVEQDVLLVGIDSLNIDDTADGTRPAHTLLLGAEIPICEHMTGLSDLPSDGFRLSAVPVKVEGMGTFPVRAFATF
jgi:kynurenine formamidase